jgi:hypothetical protein
LFPKLLNKEWVKAINLGGHKYCVRQFRRWVAKVTRPKEQSHVERPYRFSKRRLADLWALEKSEDERLVMTEWALAHDVTPNALTKAIWANSG